VTQSAPSIRCPSPALRPGTQGIKRVAVNDATAQLTVVYLAPITLPQEAYLLDPLSYTLTGGQRLFPPEFSRPNFTVPPVRRWKRTACC